jgi:F-type H+-transporting ATPase subunit b
MRTRTLFAAGLLGVVGVLTFGSAAFAQEGEEEGGEGATEEVVHEAEEIAEANGAEHSDIECIPILVEGGSVDDCQEAPNPILPATNELIWGSISFTVLLVLLAKFAWPAMKQGLEARTERIRSDLAGAESAKDEAERVLSEYRAQLADAKAEAGRIVEEARQQADAVKRDQESRVQTEIAAMRERAAADVESAKAQALADLRRDVADLAIGAAEVIVQRSLDRETQTQLVEQYIDSVTSSSN